MRTKKALYNIISSGIYQVVSIICGLIVPRLILTHYGSTYNGVYSSLTQMLGMVSILTLGIGGATRVELYKSLARNDLMGTSRIMKATKAFMHKVGIALVVYTAIMLVFYPLISHNSLSFGQNDIIIVIVAVSVFGEYYFAMPNKMLLAADQAGYVSHCLYTVARIIETLLITLLVGFGYSFFIVKGASVLVFLIAPVLLDLFIQKKYGLIDDCEPDNTGIRNRNAVVFHSIANTIHNHSDVFLLTLFTDAKVLSVYSVYYLVLGKMKSIMQIFTNGLEAAFGNMWVKGELEIMRKRFLMCEHGLYCFVGVVFSCVSVLIIPFIRLYTAGVTDINYIIISFAVLATITEAIYCIREPYVILVQASGKYEETKKGAAVEAAVNLITSLLLIKPLGLNGVIIGTLVANLIRTIQYALFASKHILQISWKRIILKAFWLICTVAIIVGAYEVLNHITAFQYGWKGWIIQSSIIFVIACAVVFFMSMVFYKDNMEQLFLLLHKKRTQRHH